MFERERLLRVDHNPWQARRIKRSFFEIEFPSAVLLRHQAALQAVGEARNDALQMTDLLIEIGPQTGQFFSIAEFFGRNRLVEFGREEFIVGDPAIPPRGRRRTARLGGIIRVRSLIFLRHFTGRTVL